MIIEIINVKEENYIVRSERLEVRVLFTHGSFRITNAHHRFLSRHNTIKAAITKAVSMLWETES